MRQHIWNPALPRASPKIRLRMLTPYCKVAFIYLQNFISSEANTMFWQYYCKTTPM